MANIEVHSYRPGGMIEATINGQHMFVPDDMRNRDRQIIAEWQEAGNSLPPVSPPTPLIPGVISDRQFFQQLASEDLITEDEALDAVGPGTIPQAMLALINQLPAEDQFAAKMLIRGATTFERLHPVTILVQQLYQWTDAKRDEFWTAASLL